MKRPSGSHAVPQGSDGEGAAAAAGLGGVGIGEIEPTADQGRAEVQLHSVDVQKALGITDHPETFAFS